MSLPPLPQRGYRSPPALVDEAMREIFRRISPNDPKSLLRAAAVCSAWRAILSDAAFARDYRAFWRAPPMLGFLYDERYADNQPLHDKQWVSHFVSTATFRPPACEDRQHWHVLDSRHGLVLFLTPRSHEDFVVCDLVTNDQWRIPADPKCYDIMWWNLQDDEYDDERLSCNAAVLCAKDRCDHLDCHGGPFRVALVGSGEQDARFIISASVYSSETCEWSDVICIQQTDVVASAGHSAVVGNKVYFPCVESDSVVELLEYNIDEQELSVIDAPFEDQDHPYIRLVGVDDGMLLFASVVNPRLYLWSMKAGSNGALVLARYRVMELEPLLPSYVLSNRSDVSAVGFAEGVIVIFLRTRNGLYTIDLNSGQGEKVHNRRIEKVMPYMSYYTGAWGLLLTLE